MKSDELLMAKKTLIIKKLIKARIRTNPLAEGDIQEHMVDKLPYLSIWGTPEGTILNMIVGFNLNRTAGDTEAETIKKLDSNDPINFYGKLPSKLNEYIKLKVNAEHSFFANYYPISFIDMCILIVSTEMGYPLSNKVSLSGQEAEYVSKHNQTVKAKNTGCIALIWIIGIGVAIFLLTKL